MTASPTYGELTNKGASTNIAWHEASVGRDERSKPVSYTHLRAHET